jgi:hypothetical protein
MAAMIELSGVGFDKLKAEIAHIKGGMDKAIARASMRVARQGKTEISKDIRSQVRIKAADVGALIEVKKTTGGGAYIKLKETQKVSLRVFDAKQNGRGVSYAIAKGKRGFVQSAFIAESLGGSVYKRYGARVIATKGRYKGKLRQRIAKLHGPSVWGVFVFNNFYEPTLKRLSEKYESRLRHEIKFLMDKAKQTNV